MCFEVFFPPKSFVASVWHCFHVLHVHHVHHVHRLSACFSRPFLEWSHRFEMNFAKLHSSHPKHKAITDFYTLPQLGWEGWRVLWWLGRSYDIPQWFLDVSGIQGMKTHKSNILQIENPLNPGVKTAGPGLNEWIQGSVAWRRFQRWRPPIAGWFIPWKIPSIKETDVLGHFGNPHLSLSFFPLKYPWWFRCFFP